MNVVRDAWEKLDLDFKLFASDNFALHVVALYHAWSRNSRQVDVKLERHLANVFDVEVFGGGFIVRYFTVIELVSGEFVADVA